MRKPSAFFVHQPKPGIDESGDDFDPVTDTEEIDFTTAAEAFAYMKERGGFGVFERRNIHDVTPVGDPPGVLWDWDERCIDDEEGAQKYHTEDCERWIDGTCACGHRR